MKKINKAKEEMTVAELRDLVVKLELVTKSDAKSMKKPLLLEVLGQYESANTPKEETEEVGGVAGDQKVSEEWALGFHEGKKILSIVPVELNGKNYNDITVEGGVTYRVNA